MNSSYITIIISLVILFGLALLISTGMRRNKPKEEHIPNLTKYKTDRELETKHLDKVLIIAVLVSSLLTIMIPLIIFIIIIGIFPNIFLDPMRIPIENIITNYNLANGK